MGWLIPTIQSIHILALAVGFTSAAIVDLRLLGVAARGQPLRRMSQRFLPTVGWGVLLLLVTGLLLMVAEPRRALLNPFFQLKMAALVVVGGLTLAIAAIAASDRGRSIGKPLAVVSIGLWLTIIALGRWIAYGP
ncbi:MAG: DUF6644 family protein [Caulobacteraceae bacterium]